MSGAPRPDWIAADWGASTLRVWAMAANGSPLAEARSDDGMARLAPEGSETALLRLVTPWLSEGGSMPVVICGMAGARQGWREAPYRAVPCAPLGSEVLTFRGADPRLAVAIVPGLSQAKPADVMRGGKRRRSPAFSPQPPVSTASPACPAPIPNGRRSAPARSWASRPA